MGKGRWLYENYLHQAAAIRVSSAAAGQVGRAVAESQGVAMMHASGEFMGDDALKYEVLVDDLSQGSGVGQARFRWRTSAGEAWEAAGVATSAAMIELSHGVRIKWSSGGGGDDFAAGDRWTFLAVRPRGKAGLLDMGPDSDWRAMGCADESVTIDLGQARAVGALVLGWHNLSGDATATLMGNDADQWDAPAFSLGLDIASPHLATFLEESHRYWRLALGDPGNPEGVIRAGGLYLGGFLEPSVNHAYGLKRVTAWQRKERKAGGILLGASASGRSRSLSLAYRRATEQDAEALEDMLGAAHGAADGCVRPVWFCPDSGQPGELVHGLPTAELTRSLVSPGPNRFDLSLTLREIPRRSL